MSRHFAITISGQSSRWLSDDLGESSTLESQCRYRTIFALVDAPELPQIQHERDAQC